MRFSTFYICHRLRGEDLYRITLNKLLDRLIKNSFLKWTLIKKIIDDKNSKQSDKKTAKPAPGTA